MKVLFSGRLSAGERARWLEHLAASAEGITWVLSTTETTPDSIEAAVVADPEPSALAGLPRLRLVQSLWAGVDRLLADPTLPPHVPLARMVDPAMNVAMAETALWAVLSLHRSYFDYQRLQREGRWSPLAQRRADEVPVLVLGYGQMGRTVSQTLAAQGYPVCAWRLSGESGSDGPVTVGAGARSLEELRRKTRVVINLLPLTESTRGILSRPFFEAMPRGAAVVNLARGAHLVDDDLLEALDTGGLGHAVLDVFHVEPLPVNHRFWRHPHITLLPHAAAMTDPRTASRVVAENLRALREGAPLAHLVDRGRGY